MSEREREREVVGRQDTGTSENVGKMGKRENARYTEKNLHVKVNCE